MRRAEGAGERLEEGPITQPRPSRFQYLNGLAFDVGAQKSRSRVDEDGSARDAVGRALGNGRAHAPVQVVNLRTAQSSDGVSDRERIDLGNESRTDRLAERVAEERVHGVCEPPDEQGLDDGVGARKHVSGPAQAHHARNVVPSTTATPTQKTLCQSCSPVSVRAASLAGHVPEKVEHERSEHRAVVAQAEQDQRRRALPVLARDGALPDHNHVPPLSAAFTVQKCAQAAPNAPWARWPGRWP